MVTVLDALGTPTPIYSKSGTAFVNLESTVDSAGAAVEIPAVSAHVIVVASPINPPGLGDGFKFSVDFNYGDVVSICQTVAFDYKLYDENDVLLGTITGSTTALKTFMKVPNGLSREWVTL